MYRLESGFGSRGEFLFDATERWKTKGEGQRRTGEVEVGREKREIEERTNEVESILGEDGSDDPG